MEGQQAHVDADVLPLALLIRPAGVKLHSRPQQRSQCGVGPPLDMIDDHFMRHSLHPLHAVNSESGCRKSTRDTEHPTQSTLARLCLACPRVGNLWGCGHGRQKGTGATEGDGGDRKGREEAGLWLGYARGPGQSLLPLSIPTSISWSVWCRIWTASCMSYSRPPRAGLKSLYRRRSRSSGSMSMIFIVKTSAWVEA